MTTDTVPKAASRRISVDGAQVTVTGMAKGAGMISPNMATMLGFVATDAPLSAPLLRSLAIEVADASFNRITIDGDTSTNDSFVLIATARAPMAPITNPSDARLTAVRAALDGVAQDLARGHRSRRRGRPNSSPLRSKADVTSTNAIALRRDRQFTARQDGVLRFGSESRRIVCAIGNGAGADLDPARVSFWLDDTLVVRDGGRAESYREEDGQRAMAKPEIAVRVALGRGQARATVWTCDFSHEYVSINADYRS
jgi:glutamate N-acetyltransferase/amino-acid N-acetyltransferase